MFVFNYVIYHLCATILTVNIYHFNTRKNMGLLKWLKREREFSPMSKRRLSEPPSMGNKTKLVRNESYLKALTKFNKWRQTYLLSNTNNRDSLSFSNQKDVWTEDLTLNTGKFTAMDLIYEEIDEDFHLNTNYQHNRSFSEWKSPPAFELLPKKKQKKSIKYENSENIIPNSNSNSSNNSKRCSSSSCNSDITNGYNMEIKFNENYEQIDEPEYAIPCVNTSSEHKEYEISESYVEKDFNFLNRSGNEIEMHCNKLSKHKLIVTDLDQSQTSIDNLNINREIENLAENYSLTNFELFPEFMLYRLTDIVEVNIDNNFDITSGNIKHGIVKYIDISYLLVDEHNFNEINQNFESLRALRHPNILLLMGVSFNTNSALEALILEPLKCVLYDVIHIYRRIIEVTDCYNYILQIMNAVIYLNQHQLIHSNICSRNIVLCQTSGVLKLAGFELITKSEHYAVQDKFTSTPVNDKNSSTNLSCSIEYRKRYSMHFYQAPELLSETKQYIQPTYKSDVYGICLTLWEMLNCVIPYGQFSYSELVKVFSLKTAQLPTYEEQRNLPFKTLFDGGLDIQMHNRFENVVLLKNLLQNNKIKNLITKAKNQKHCCQQSHQIYSTEDLNALNKSNKIEKLLNECTSTIKKQKKSTISTKFNDSKSQNCETRNIFDTFCTPKVAKNMNKMNRNFRKPLNFTEPATYDVQENHLKEIIITPNRKYNVNIVIKSKCTPNSVTSSSSGFGSNEKKAVNELKRNSNSSVMDNNVKEKICKFESIISVSPNSNKCLDNSITSRTSALGNLKFKNQKKYNLSDCKKPKMRNINIEESNLNLDHQKQSITTQDFYIDDDLLSDSYIGDNLILNLNYVHGVDGDH